MAMNDMTPWRRGSRNLARREEDHPFLSLRREMDNLLERTQRYYTGSGANYPLVNIYNRDDQVLVSDIHPADRQRFFDWCQGRHAEAAATVEPFPGSRELDSGVDAGGSGGIDGGSTE